MPLSLYADRCRVFSEVDRVAVATRTKSAETYDPFLASFIFCRFARHLLSSRISMAAFRAPYHAKKAVID